MCGKLSIMNLRQIAEQDVKRMLATHGTDLGNVRACLDLSAQETGGYWETPNPDFVSIDGCVRTGHIRQLAAGQLVRQPTTQAVLQTLRLKVKSFAALHLLTPDGKRIRTRTRPVVRRTGKPMRALPAGSEQEPLFGDEDLQAAQEAAGALFGYGPPSQQPYEISILMDIGLGTKSLTGAWLAAIDWGKDDKGRTIYYEEQIPALPMQLGGSTGGGNPPNGSAGWNRPGNGFEDFLQDEGEETGSDPA
jgi:hypothetical protein